MKEGWTYKKLGEVATVVGGSTPKSNIEEYWGGTHYWVTPADLNGNKYQGATPRTITDLAVKKTNLQLLPIGTVLLSSRAPIGKVAITTVPMYCNQGFKNIVCSHLLINEFVYWYLFGKVDYLNSLGRGATFKEISKRATEQIPIPVPSIAEQERIVAELDLLSGIIEKKKEQLKAYDQLAQSIFYTMFGDDPIDNPKGWEIKKLEALCDRIVDCPHSTPKKVDYVTQYPCIRTSELKGGTVQWETMQYLDECEYNKRITRLKPIVGDIVFGREGSIGDAVILPKGYHFSLGQRTMLLRANGRLISNVFLHRTILSEWVKRQIDAVNVSSTVAHVNIKDFKLFDIPVPPLSLQQEFAEKVEAIERQKALVQQSIEEIQTMFDYTMDKYFG